MHILFKTTIVFVSLLAFVSCEKKARKVVKSTLANNIDKIEDKPIKVNISKDFKEYWYAGKAELSSYKLSQARYGQLREGKAVLVYVTEPFLKDKQVKADKAGKHNVGVLKLNSTKNFLTGVYPYSIMNSTFYPIHNQQHAIKVSSSIQEWCGHVYTQLNNKSQFEVQSYSYFESEGDQKFSLEKQVLENELWTKIRIDPNTLPQGNFKSIPALEYVRFRHVALKAYAANASISTKNGVSSYILHYPELERNLTIDFNTTFPYEILGWQETFKSGFGSKAKQMTTTAKRINTIKSAYWGKNSNSDVHLRDSLGI